MKLAGSSKPKTVCSRPVVIADFTRESQLVTVVPPASAATRVITAFRRFMGLSLPWLVFLFHLGFQEVLKVHKCVRSGKLRRLLEARQEERLQTDAAGLTNLREGLKRHCIAAVEIPHIKLQRIE